MYPEEVRQYVLKKRYLLPDETEDDMYRRVAEYIGNDDKQIRDFYWMMSNHYFLPNSPCLMNAGTSNPMLSACFVLPVPDDLAGIFDAVKYASIVHKYGGGTGFSFSQLRPNGDIVNGTNGVASGAVSFMKVFDAATEQVKQGGKRRGANMGVLSITHPDIEEFITCKRQEGILSNFNISVAVTDDFLTALRDNQQWNLINPRNNQVWKTVNAKTLFDEIVKSIWVNGEPGVLFIDRINHYHTCKHLGTIDATNPCLPKGTLLFDGDRFVKIEDSGKTFESWFTGVKQCIKLVLSDGGYIICTPDHKILTTEGWTNAEDTLGKRVIRIGDRYYSGDITHDDNVVLFGFLYGDGYICANGEGCSVKLNENKEPDVAEMLYNYGFKKQPNGCFYINVKKLTFVDYNMLKQTTHNKVLPEWILTSNVNFVASFLKGLYTANGSVISNYRVSFKTVSGKLAEQVKTLLSLFGIHAYITVNKPKTIKWSNGEYTSKESYNVEISNYESLVRFRKYIGFVDKSKMKKLDIAIASRSKKGRILYPKVVKIEHVGALEVYDFKMKDNKPYNSACGYIVHNCGEQPLLPYESCVLGSINLAKMVNGNDIDWKLLDRVTRLAVQFLDNVIDKNKYPLPEIEKATKRTRKIGLGVMGWHDMLLQLGIPYDSKEALDLAQQVMKSIENSAVSESIALAEEHGVFPAWEGSTWNKEHGVKIRNATLTTIAPTGSISMIAKCSPSIEPVFSFAFVRSHIVDKDKQTVVVHPLFKKHVDEDVIKEVLRSGTTQLDIIPENVKRLFKGALDIHWKWHIDMQATFQLYTHNAVSKTINMPNNTTVDEIKHAILYAYEKGCKGITIYREGSRTHEVMSLDKSTPKRPRMLSGVTYSARSGCGKMYVTINMNDGTPYEVFVRTAGGCEANNEAIGRLISLALRSGISADRIINQLQKVKCINAMRSKKSEGKSCADVIAKLLSGVLGDNNTNDRVDRDEVPVYGVDRGETVCPECGAKLNFSSGCRSGVCPNCGWSGCL